MKGSYFSMTAAAHEMRHPMSDLALLEAELDEMEARNAARASTPPRPSTKDGRAAAAHSPAPVAVLDHEGIWAHVNGKTKAEVVAPKAAPTSLDVDAIWRRYNNGGPNPDPLLVRK